MRIVLCGHVGDYDDVLKGWEIIRWDRGKMTWNGGNAYGGKKTVDKEVMYLSPTCQRTK